MNWPVWCLNMVQNIRNFFTGELTSMVFEQGVEHWRIKNFFIGELTFVVVEQNGECRRLENLLTGEWTTVRCGQVLSTGWSRSYPLVSVPLWCWTRHWMQEDQEPLHCWVDHCGKVQSGLCGHMAISFDIPHFPSSTLECHRLGVWIFFYILLFSALGQTLCTLVACDSKWVTSFL